MRTPIGRALRKSYGRTVADVWKVTERRTSKAAFERNSYSGVTRHEQVFPGHHRRSARHACRAIRIYSPHTIGPPHSAESKRTSTMKKPARMEVVRRAYELWEKAGKPEGRDQEFYHQAERELEEKSEDPETPEGF